MSTLFDLYFISLAASFMAWPSFSTTSVLPINWALTWTLVCHFVNEIKLHKNISWTMLKKIKDILFSSPHHQQRWWQQAWRGCQRWPPGRHSPQPSPQCDMNNHIMDEKWGSPTASPPGSSGWFDCWSLPPLSAFWQCPCRHQPWIVAVMNIVTM